MSENDGRLERAFLEECQARGAAPDSVLRKTFPARSGMVERVAIALDEVMYKPERKTDWEQAPAQHHDVCRRLARHAIASMRNPTDEMMAAVDCAGEKAEWVSGQAWKVGYSAMIDAAVLA